MIHRCPWCRQLFFNDNEGFKEHTELHASIDLLNGNSVCCPLCRGVELTTFHAWEKHMQQHESTVIELSDSSLSLAKFDESCDLNVNETRGTHSALNDHIPSSPVAGPSHETPYQTGHGSDETDDSALPYSFTQIREKTFKNGVKDRHFRVKFYPEESLEGQKLSKMHNGLLNMFNDVISEATNNLQGSDLCRVVVNHPSLTNSVFIPLKKIDDMTGEDVLQQFENVLNSHQDLEMTDGFSVDVGTMELPKGGKFLPIHCLTGPEDAVRNKRSIIQIKNTDNNCLARSVGVAFAAANVVSLAEWRELTKHDCGLSIEQQVLKYKKCPQWFKKTIVQQSKRQNDFAALLCREAGLAVNKFLTICDISRFEELLNVDILVVSSRLGNKFMRVPSDENSIKQRLYLYLVELDKSFHFHVITNISRYFGKKFCSNCLLPYQKLHKCKNSCFVCKRKDNCTSTNCEMSCRSCHMTCKSMSCFESHKSSENKKQSECEHWWKCTVCKKIIDKNKQNAEEHVCNTYQCRSCKKMVESNTHNCYIRSVNSKETLPRYIFFDFETTQVDKITECHQGYVSNKTPHCAKCKELGSDCAQCSLCKNCVQSDCGKFTHEPNLVVASTACEVCINDNSVASQSKCDFCGTRCARCNKFNKKEQCYEKPLCNTCGYLEVVFKGEDTKRDFGKWLFSRTHKDFTAIAHNAKGFDSYFILQYLIDNSIRPEIIYSGSKIMYIHVQRGLNIRIVDSLNFLPMKLAKLPDAFGLEALKKGFFPHLFSSNHHFSYTGKYPSPEFYCPDYMSSDERAEFLVWYKDKIDRGEQFDLQKEIVEYCQSDVHILRNACLRFREIILSITGTQEVHFDEEDGALDTKCKGGIDPFQLITIASLCMRIFKSKFLPENWEIKVTNNNEISDWLPACLVDDKFTVDLNGTSMTSEQLQENGYLIEDKKFVCSPIAQVPSYGYSSRDTFSMASIQWLEWYMEDKKSKGNPIHIRHALNGGEVKISGTNYRVDGYAEIVSETNEQSKKRVIALDYYGCFWHGCPVCFTTQRHQIKLPRTGQSLEELWTLTKKREQCIKALGIEHITIWEHQFHELLRSNETANTFVKSLDLQERLNPRDAFYGGRVNATQLYYKANTGEKINYLDVCSLYPSVNKYAIYPIKEPTIVTSDFGNIEQYFGIAKIKILPPRNLYHPVLPVRMNGKLVFPLCRTCGSKQIQDPCKCSDEDRCLIGTWCTPEIMKSIEHGYTILKIFEIYHWNETSQFNRETGESGLFAGYIDMFLKLKQEASGWPDSVASEKDKAQYLSDYKEREGIVLDKENIKKNPALGSIAKLLLNSFWGKFGENMRKNKTSFFHESEADKFFQCISNPSKTVKDFYIISDDMIQLTWEDTKNLIPEDYKTNIFIAAFTTCWARLKLFSLLEMLDRRVLYFDTDSVIFVSRVGDKDPETGSFLGELTNELKKPGDFITEFVSGGPKNYAFKTLLGEQVCKVKGFSFNYKNSKLINFSSMLQLVSNPREKIVNSVKKLKLKKRKRKDRQSENEVNKVVVTNERKITRQKLKRKLYNRVEQKEYRIVYDKRVLQKDSFDTLPYGY